jgi:hypothetical protein
MPKMKKQNTKTSVPPLLLLARLSLAGLFVIGLVFAFTRINRPVSAATNSTINFQARLLTAAGSVAPDGYYNVEFKLYKTSAPDGGETAVQGSCTTNPGAAADEDCLWTETRIGADKVRVANGYLTVNLGSVTAFGGAIPWDQEMWLTMNIGGTGSPSWDGEMNPRLKLTSSPYAQRTGAIVSSDGLAVATVDESGTICIQNSTNCGFLTSDDADSGYVQLQGDTPGSPQTGNLNISGTAIVGALKTTSIDATSAAVINIGTATASGVLIGKTGGSVTLQGDTYIGDLASPTSNSSAVCRDISTYKLIYCDANTTNRPHLQGGSSFGATAVVGTGDNQSMQLVTNGIARLTINTNNQLYLGSGATSASPGSFSISTASSTTAGAAGGSLTIESGNGASSSTGSEGGDLTLSAGDAGGSGDNDGGVLMLQGGSATGNGIQGRVVVRTSGNSTEAFDVENGSGNNIFTVDTVNARVGINLGSNATPTLSNAGLEIQGALRLSGDQASDMDLFTTPLGGTVRSKINIPIYNPGQYNQVVAMGMPLGAHVDARVLSLFDRRATSHQPTLAVFSPDQNQIIGFSWDGSDTHARIKTTSTSFGLTVGGADQIIATTADINLYQNTTVAGTLTGTTLNGTTGINTGASAGTQRIDSSGNLLNIGNITASGTYNTNTFTSSSLQFGAATAASIQSAASQALNITANAASTFKTSSGMLTLQAASTANQITVNTTGATTLTAASTITLQTNSTSSIFGASVNAARLYVPWASGDALPTLYVGSTNSSNNMLSIRAASYSDSGIWGSSVTGDGIYGESTNSFGIVGEGGLAGVLGTSSAGVGVQGESTSSFSGFYKSGSNSNTAATLVVEKNGSSTANLLQIRNDGATSTYFSIGASGETTVKSATATAFRVLNGSDVPLFTADNSTNRVYIGNTSDDTTGVLLILDTKTSAGDPTGVAGGMYYNSSMGRMRCYYDSKWRFCNDPAGLTWGLNIEEDFIGGGSTNNCNFGEGNWCATTGAGSGVVQQITPDTGGRPGQIQLSTGTTSGTTGSGSIWLSEDQESMIVGGGEEIEFATNLNALATSGTADYDFRAGLCDVSDNTFATCREGLFFEYDRDSSTNWRAVTANGGTTSATVSSTSGCVANGTTNAVAVATGWTRFKIVVNTAANQVDYYVNGSFIGCITTNIPTSNTTQPCFLIIKDASGGGTNYTVRIDYFQYRKTLTTPR